MTWGLQSHQTQGGERERVPSRPQRSQPARTSIRSTPFCCEAPSPWGFVTTASDTATGVVRSRQPHACMRVSGLAGRALRCVGPFTESPQPAACSMGPRMGSALPGQSVPASSPLGAQGGNSLWDSCPFLLCLGQSPPQGQASAQAQTPCDSQACERQVALPQWVLAGALP